MTFFGGADAGTGESGWASACPLADVALRGVERLEVCSVAGERGSEQGVEELLKGSILFSMPQRRFPPFGAFSAAGGARADVGGDDSARVSLGPGLCDPEEGFEGDDRMLSNERNIPGGVGWSFLIISRQRPGAGLHGAVEGATRSCFSAHS